VGAKREVASDFRVIAASNRDLDEMIRLGRFRKDLLFRLKAHSIDLPSLRDRSRDICELAMYHAARLSECSGAEPKSFSPEFFEALLSHDWPGNVRELVNTVHRSFIASGRDPVLLPKHLPAEIRIRAACSYMAEAKEEFGSDPLNIDQHRPAGLPSMHDFRSIAEREYLERLMAETEGDMEESRRISGLSRSRLYQLFKKHNLEHHT
jgi:two-component system NtrC family response regulator